MGLLEDLIIEADNSNFRCSYCSAIACDCNSEAGEPDGF
jgi:hypothetical protein